MVGSRHLLVVMIGWFALAVPVASAEGDDGKAPSDSIVVCGQKFAVGTPVVLWSDPGGYDAYSLFPHFARPESQPEEKKKPRYGSRTALLSPSDAQRVEKNGWDLPTLQSVVDQFVIHYDVCGTSARCFQVLQDSRGLSVHFMLDLDGTIYQTLDLKESAWHATKSNRRSIGIEIANMGAYPPDQLGPLDRWYVKDDKGQVRITIPDELGKRGLRHPDLTFHPVRNELIRGTIRGQALAQYDLTPQQYEALAKLTATLCEVFPKLKRDVPRYSTGKVRLDTLSDAEWQAYQGILGHWHVQTNKTDPGPAFQWDRILEAAH